MLSLPSTPSRRIAAASARIFLRARYLLFQKHRMNRTVIERICGFRFIVLPGVLNPHIFLTGRFFCCCLKSTHIPPGSRILDLGTGSGCCAVAAAKPGTTVTATDIQPTAVRNARMNAVRNRTAGRVHALCCDLFEALRPQTFDVILFNPPFFPKPSGEVITHHAWDYGDLPLRFAAGLNTHLKPGGYALILLSTAGRCTPYLEELRRHGFRFTTAARKDFGCEILTLFRVERNGETDGE